jgi:hypothetical protein
MKFKELFSDALPLIKNFAPTIGLAIGGPYGVASGYAVSLLANLFSADPSDIKQLVSNIVQDPEATEKLQKLEMSHADWLSGLMKNVNKLAKAEVNIKLEWAPN